MTKCPKCNSDNLEVQTEVAYIAYTTSKIINSEIKGFKKSDLKNPPLFEIRVFIKCIDCKYETENASHNHNSDFDNDFVEDITCKITDLIREPRSRRTVDFDKKYSIYFQKNPTYDEIIEYMNKNKMRSTFNISIFKKYLDEYLNRDKL
ncbi:hypothetical protein [Paenibacillus medicaginis]|uniref:Uncharacterized protein n=1 Tax=Paenibacillus medicaginis TaxID=1470560 RepID=A0ABV5BUR6_9BACL